MFLRKSRLEPLPIAMTGVRMGERLLQIGADDLATAAALAKKIGLSGVNALAVTSESEAERALAAAAEAAVLIDVQVSSPRMLPFEKDAFDLVVVHGARGFLERLSPEDRVAWLREALRVLRPGGRAIVIEAATRGGLAGLLRSREVNEHYVAGGGAEGALKAEGFRPVRVLGEVEGHKFTEGLKT